MNETMTNDEYRQHETELLELADAYTTSGLAYVSKLADMFAGRCWEVTGHDTWHGWFAEVVPHDFVAISRDDRPRAVYLLRMAGMPQAVIAEVVGTAQKTVSRDLSQMTNVDFPPILAADGKDYTNGTGRPRGAVNTEAQPWQEANDESDENRKDAEDDNNFIGPKWPGWPGANPDMGLYPWEPESWIYEEEELPSRDTEETRRVAQYNEDSTQFQVMLLSAMAADDMPRVRALGHALIAYADTREQESNA